MIGDPVTRVDGRLKVTGGARYSGEIAMKSMAYAVLVTSTVAKGTIRDIDTRAALAVPHVVTVLTFRNAPRLPNQGRGTAEQQHSKRPPIRPLSLLQTPEVRYSNEPIAVVVADTLEAAHEGAALVKVHYQAERPTTLLEEPPVHAPKVLTPPQEKVDFSKGDAAAAFAGAPVKLDVTYRMAAETHNPMEPHATLAVWDGDRVTLFDATQGIFGCRGSVAAAFGIPKEKVRVVSHFLGGGFGCKGPAWSHVILAAMAARAVKRPVRLALERRQMFGQVGHRPENVQHLQVAAEKDGRLVTVSHSLLAATSVFEDWTETAGVPCRMMYTSPNIRSTHRLVKLNIGTPSFMRAPGISSGMYSLECAMDELAWKTGIDPLELRLRNYADRDPKDGKPFSSKSLRQCYQTAAERFGWSRWPAAVRATRDGVWWVGWGMASVTYPAHQAAATATATLKPDGRLLVRAGSQDIGTGTYTIMTQIAADTLGMPIDHVTFELGDTEFPETPVSGGSQTAASTGSAVLMASRGLCSKLASLATADTASPLHGVAADQIEVRDGKLTGGGHSETLQAFVRRHGKPVEATVQCKPAEDREKWSTHAFGAHFCEVRVDADLCTVRVSRWVSAMACGKVLNAKTARSQIMGGVTMGIGMALTEDTALDRRLGRIVTATLADYHVPVNADVPDIDVTFIPEDDPHVNPAGVKGIGEIGIVGVAPAIANAVYHATGIRVRSLPITPDVILAAAAAPAAARRHPPA